MRELTRRSMLRAAGAALGLPLVGLSDSAAAGEAGRKLKIIVVGGHPGDPEAMCGGTIARYTDLGHEVVNLYLTRGEAGIPGKSHDEAARIRTAEGLKACEILKARPVFAGQIDGSTEITPARYGEFLGLIHSEQPDVVFTHWPLDTHRDHRAASLLAYDAWLASGRRFGLYFGEVGTGAETQAFLPNHYVDITRTEARKRASCYAHASQNPDQFYAVHDMMNRFRGMEAGTKYAEAFVRHVQNSDEPLPVNV